VIFLVISSLLSLGLIWAVNALARNKGWGMAGACCFAAVASLFSFGLLSTAIGFQSALTVAGLLACIVFRCNPKAVLPVSIAALVASYAFFLLPRFVELRKIARLRQENPLVSVADRLQYEAKAVDAFLRTDDASQLHELNPDIEQRLSMVEGGFFGSNQSQRQDSLHSLHFDISDDFVMARGFGPVRMAEIRTEGIDLPNSPPIPLPSAPAEPDHDFERNSAAPLANQTVANTTPTRGALLSMHDSGIRDFIEPERMGFVKDRDHVAGFISHRFTKLPEPALPNDRSRARWQITRLALVSLLTHEVPVAYVSKNLPQMDELRDAATRPLDSFEQQAIDRLRADDDLVIDDGADRIRMMGSLRAGKNCLNCHSVRRGDLLGALSYELVPARPAPKQGPPASPPSS